MMLFPYIPYSFYCFISISNFWKDVLLVLKSSIILQGHYALVEFCEKSSAINALKQKDHRMSSTKLIVKPRFLFVH